MLPDEAKNIDLELESELLAPSLGSRWYLMATHSLECIQGELKLNSSIDFWLGPSSSQLGDSRLARKCRGPDQDAHEYL